MSKNSWNHFTKNPAVTLALIFLLGYANADVYGVSFPDYFPLDAPSHGIKTFQWTYGNTGTYSSSISGTLTVPYTSGAIQGTGIVNFEEGMTLYATNDGAEVKLLSTSYAYFSNDQLLTAHPAAWTFSTVTDDMLVDVGSYYDVDFDLASSYLVDYLAILFDIQNVTVPFGQHSDAVIMWFLDEDYSFTGLNFQGKAADLGINLPSSATTGGRSVTDFYIYAYGIGMIAWGDIDAETGELLDLAELVDIESAGPVDLDIDWISMTSSKDYENGAVPAYPPWMFDIYVHLVDPDTLHHIDVTPPAGGAPFTIYEDPIDGYVYDLPIRYSTLADLRAVYPDGNYTFDFRDVSDTLLSSVTLNNSGLSEPSSPVNFIYPSTNGQTGIGTNPTFTWTVDPGAGDALSLWVQDFSSDYEAYISGLVSMTTLSWTPGPLLPNHEYGLDVSVYEIKDLQPGPAWPTMTVGGDTFAYGLRIEYLNMIDFTTVPIYIVPDTIRTNTKSITCHIWPLDGYDVSEIDLDSIRLNDDTQPSRISVRKKQQMLVVKFPTSGLSLLVPGPLELTVTGKLTDTTQFEGTDSVEVVQKGGKPS